MVGSLIVTSIYEDDSAPSKAARDRAWQAFLNAGTTHSAQAHMLPWIMRKCEREGIGYTLTAAPGEGYFITPTRGQVADAPRETDDA